MPITKPTIYFTLEAYRMVIGYVMASELECSMMGEVETHKNTFLVTKVHLPQQTRSAAFTKITHDGVASLLTNPSINPQKIKAWFHSHVNMGVTPSGQDEKQAQELMSDAEWFIRGIFNKRGEYSLFIHWHGIDIEAKMDILYEVGLDIDALKAELESVTIKDTTLTKYSGKNKQIEIFNYPKCNYSKYDDYPTNDYTTYNSKSRKSHTGLFNEKPRIAYYEYKDMYDDNKHIVIPVFNVWDRYDYLKTYSSFKNWLYKDILGTPQAKENNIEDEILADLFSYYVELGEWFFESERSFSEEENEEREQECWDNFNTYALEWVYGTTIDADNTITDVAMEKVSEQH